jgi:hypothetical protein
MVNFHSITLQRGICYTPNIHMSHNTEAMNVVSGMESVKLGKYIKNEFVNIHQSHAAYDVLRR